MSHRTKFVLDEEHTPRAWYNIVADLPVPPPPPLHPGTGLPLGPDDLAPLFPMALILQEVSTDRYIEIPDPIRDAYQLYRPSPIYRAHRLEKALDTPAHIYYKYEGVSPGGSHKPNTAFAQAWFNKNEGVTRLATETGAGQWGTSLAIAGALYGLECGTQVGRKGANEVERFLPGRDGFWRSGHGRQHRVGQVDRGRRRQRCGCKGLGRDQQSNERKGRTHGRPYYRSSGPGRVLPRVESRPAH